MPRDADLAELIRYLAVNLVDKTDEVRVELVEERSANVYELEVAESDLGKVIGGIARAHGIRGEVVIVTHDPDSEELAVIDTIYVGGVPRKIAGARDTQRGWLVALEGIATRNDAEALRGQPVEIDRDQLDLAADDILLADLVGCAVRRADGSPWGTIAAIEVDPFQDRLVIHDGDVERLLPLVDAFVTDIDLDAKLVTVDPPEGLPETKRQQS